MNEKTFRWMLITELGFGIFMALALVFKRIGNKTLSDPFGILAIIFSIVFLALTVKNMIEVVQETKIRR